MRSDTVRLWTIQHSDAWATAESRGVLRADGRRVWPEFHLAHDWMGQQMHRRIAGATGRYPIWAWMQPKPDLRRAAHLPPGTPGVRIEFRADAAKVLLSDFDAWHVVLNQGYLALTEEEDEAWEVSVGRGRRFDDLSPAQQAAIALSWERIFDLPSLLTSSWWHVGRADQQYIQATIAEVPLSQVVEVRPFAAR